MNQQEIWQVEVQGQIYEANFEELTEWIAEGALLPQDKVRRGNLRWLEAGKIPALYGFFNAKQLGIAPPPVVTTTAGGNAVEQAITAGAEPVPASAAPLPQTGSFPPPPVTAAANFSHQNNVPPPPVAGPSPAAPATSYFQASPNTNAQTFVRPYQPSAQNYQGFTAPEQNSCSLHPGEEPHFVCGTCQNLFCKTCPKAYGGSVKICPTCGSMCKTLVEYHSKQQRAVQYQSDLSQGFGFADFGRALAYPFRFRFSLVSGAVLFALFSLGQSATGVGGLFMVGAGIMCLMMANCLSFACLANTVDNFAQGHLEENFMPSFDDFNLWDDVVHPFFLSVGTYIVSFGPVILLILGLMWYAWNTVTTAAQENIGQMREQLEQVKDLNRQRQADEDFLENPQGLAPSQNPQGIALPPGQTGQLDDDEIQNIEKMIHQQRQKEMESIVGKSPETQQKENVEMMQKFLRMGAAFLVLGGLSFLWGVFYFPAACAVAGYTRSFWATVNPLVGLDTIRHLGFDYVKILFMVFLMALMSGFISVVVSIVLSPFDLPGVGNLPGKFVGSLFSFYFSVVFAVLLGYALYKNSAKLNLYRG